MNSFPKIKRQNLVSCFNAMIDLYNSDQIKILDIAEIALANDQNPFIKTPNAIAPQIEHLRHRVNRVGGNVGRKTLILLIEGLYKDINTNGVVGLTLENFCGTSLILIKENVQVRLLQNGFWNLEWTLPLAQENETILLPLRKVDPQIDDIVPNYIIQYVNQAISAYKDENFLTALSLISIALEGTLRDALFVKGYTYSHGAQTVDSYEIREVEISNNLNGFNIEFQNEMPRNHVDFLNEADQNSPHLVRIKRIKKQDNWFIEIRDVDYLKDFWTSEVVAQEGQINISGLGTALYVARSPEKANILDVSILPDDIDPLIQQVRNNLIHLSENTISTVIPSIEMSIGEFASDQARVFDTIWAICGAIEKLYSKSADGTL